MSCSAFISNINRSFCKLEFVPDEATGSSTAESTTKLVCESAHKLLVKVDLTNERRSTKALGIKSNNGGIVIIVDAGDSG